MARKKNSANAKKSFGKKLSAGLLGIILIVLPLLMFAALYDYHPEDPSFNKVSSDEIAVQNFLGIFGAYVADGIYSTFGLALIIFLAVPIFWGIGLCRYSEFPEWKVRIFAWFVGLLCLACSINMITIPLLRHFGFPAYINGSWSVALSSPFNTYMNNINNTYFALIMKAIILFISIMAFNFSAGITTKMWWRFLSKIISFIRRICGGISSLLKKAVNIRSFKEFKEINPMYLQNKVHHKTMPLRREPGFDRRNDGEISATAAVSHSSLGAASTVSTAPLITASAGPVIEIPQNNSLSTGNLAIAESAETAAFTKKSSFNPTFDFIDEGDLANQNQKKAAHKITPDDIYHTEGAKTQTRTKKPAVESAAFQEELLNVPSQTADNENNKLLPQVSSLSGKTEKQKSSAVKPSKYRLPDINLLSGPKEQTAMIIDENALKARAAQLEEILNDFNIQGQIVKVSPGPVVTLYELEPKSGTKTARVIALSDDIARSMAVSSVRMAVVSGKSTIGIELPNEKRQTVWLHDLIADKEFRESKNVLNVALGKDIGGKNMYADISKMPHLLVAGTTGSGKSVGVNSMILSLLYRMTPEQCKFIMIDPKQLEFSMYNGIPHLLTPVITDPAKAVVGLKWAVQEMENRYRAMSLLNVRNIAGYNKKVEEISKTGTEIKKTIQTGFDRDTGLPIYEEQVLDTSPMPYIVIVVDEMADLMLVAGKEVEAAIQRLAQMARAAGIHLIMSTQRPSVDVITGVIKANFPSRLSFHVTTRGDSITILGEKGAEQLLGMGDMLYMPSGMRPQRIHGCFVPDEEVERIVEFIKSQGQPQYMAEVTAGELNSKDSGPVFDKGDFGGGDNEEDLYQQAVAIVRSDKKASTSYIQRKLRIGYNRAANLIERMEQEGVVSKQDHVGRREVLGVD